MDLAAPPIRFGLVPPSPVFQHSLLQNQKTKRLRAPFTPIHVLYTEMSASGSPAPVHKRNSTQDGNEYIKNQNVQEGWSASSKVRVVPGTSTDILDNVRFFIFTLNFCSMLMTVQERLARRNVEHQNETVNVGVHLDFIDQLLTFNRQQ